MKLFFELVLQDLMKSSRQSILQQFVDTIIEVLMDKDYHISEFLDAIAHHAEQEAPKSEMVQKTWGNVAISKASCRQGMRTAG